MGILNNFCFSINIKPNRLQKSVNYFLDNFNVSLTTSTKKNGSEATLGTLGK